MRLRRRKALAEAIVDILNKDLEALMGRLFELLKQIAALRNVTGACLDDTYERFIEAETIVGSRKTEEVALTAQPIAYSIEMDVKTGVLGLSLPTYQVVEEPANIPRYSLADTSAALDDAVSMTWDALKNFVQLAELEASVRAILDVIAVKRRQVNRLQYKVIPEHDSAIRYIELILEETERQDAIRVRVLQRKRKERASRS
jgi:V/A-type H+-transporting ATPase subunit D